MRAGFTVQPDRLTCLDIHPHPAPAIAAFCNASAQSCRLRLFPFADHDSGGFTAAAQLGKAAGSAS
jgi:hypothetical protein